MSMQASDQAENSKPKPDGAERRDHERFPVPVLHIRFGGKTYKTLNWSMGGFLLSDYDGPLSTGSLVSIAGLGHSARSLAKVQVRARVIRADPEGGHLAVTYLGLDDAAYEFLQNAIRDRD